MKKMLVTLTVQTEIDYDESDVEAYEEDLSNLVMELEDLGLSVHVDSEEPPNDDDLEL